MQNVQKPLVLIILDGWGHREDPEDNAIHHARTPTWDRLWQEAPHTLVSGSGLDVGLPEGQMGNSEVGHMSLGAGRVIYQSITRIDKAIEDGEFFENPAYTAAVDKAIANDGCVHIMGLLSPGGVHSHERHIRAAVDLAARRGASKVFVHAFLDGRDTPPRSARPSLEALSAHMATLGCGRIASVVGRFYAMDRDERWERVETAYRLLTGGEAPFRTADACAALDAAYERGEDDEFVQATVVCAEGEAPVRIGDGDAVLFMNFRADRARQLTRAFTEEHFSGFERGRCPRLAAFVMTTEYSADIQAECAWPPESMQNSLGELLARQGLTQMRLAETEKYAHVTFFFSGGREAPFEGEERVLVPSPRVATYDLQPEMSAPEVTDRLVEAIRGQRHDVIICNYANGDMVGHTGMFDAAVKAAEAIDASLARVLEALEEVGGEALITADHGNCEQMQDHVAGQPHTQHTTELVPFVYVGPRKVSVTTDRGRLADVAPTILALLGLPRPAEMTGQPLLRLN